MQLWSLNPFRAPPSYLLPQTIQVATDWHLVTTLDPSGHYYLLRSTILMYSHPPFGPVHSTFSCCPMGSALLLPIFAHQLLELVNYPTEILINMERVKLIHCWGLF